MNKKYININFDKFCKDFIAGFFILLAFCLILGWASADTLPIDGCKTLTGWYFENRISAIGKTYMHHALDFPANEGTPFKAVRGGIVVHAIKLNNNERGQWIEILADDGTSDLYFHSCAILVVKGQYVYEGQIIGLVGNTGASYGPHVHIQRNDSNDKPIFFTDKFNVKFEILEKHLQP